MPARPTSPPSPRCSTASANSATPGTLYYRGSALLQDGKWHPLPAARPADSEALLARVNQTLA
jgi:hypothetical protein